MVTREVFISSSINDLKAEREDLADRLTELNTEKVQFFPLMSDHPSRFHFSEYSMKNRDSVEICLENVRVCDYYVLLIKGDYHYQRKYGCSVTELEYRKAKSSKKPIFIFVFNTTSRKRATNAFIKRVSQEKWRYSVDGVDDVVRILSTILPNYNCSRFIHEDPPDGIIMKRGTRFVKTWTLKNAGNQVWDGYYMKHITPAINMIPSAEVFEIPTVNPDEEFVFSVEYDCKFEGVCISKWKMFNSEGKECFPNYLGIWAHIKIVSS